LGNSPAHIHTAEEFSEKQEDFSNSQGLREGFFAAWGESEVKGVSSILCKQAIILFARKNFPGQQQQSFYNRFDGLIKNRLHTFFFVSDSFALSISLHLYAHRFSD
jgi:hypothetical protein